MRRTACIFLAALALVGCSTTRLVPEGEYRLASNKIEVSGDGKVSPADLSPYLRQQSNSYLAFGWNPFLNIYNWSNGSGAGINGFWEKIGTPPVIFNPQLVGSTVENMTTRLEYLGYYDAKVVPEVSTVRRLAKVRYLVETGERRKIDEVVYDIPEGDFRQGLLCRYPRGFGKARRLPFRTGARGGDDPRRGAFPRPRLLRVQQEQLFLRGRHTVGAHGAALPRARLHQERERRDGFADQPLPHQQGQHLVSRRPQVQGVPAQEAQQDTARRPLQREHREHDLLPALGPERVQQREHRDDAVRQRARRLRHTSRRVQHDGLQAERRGVVELLRPPRSVATAELLP